MNACLIGDGLISLTLAKALINKKIKVFMYYRNNKKIPNESRTIGISSNNLNFIQKKIIKINKIYKKDTKYLELVFLVVFPLILLDI